MRITHRLCVCSSVRLLLFPTNEGKGGKLSLFLFFFSLFLHPSLSISSSALFLFLCLSARCLLLLLVIPFSLHHVVPWRSPLQLKLNLSILLPLFILLYHPLADGGGRKVVLLMKSSSSSSFLLFFLLLGAQISLDCFNHTDTESVCGACCFPNGDWKKYIMDYISHQTPLFMLSEQQLESNSESPN